MALYWVTCGLHNYYPVIELEFVGSSDQQDELALLFDSGADANYVNAEILRSAVPSFDDYNFAIADMRGTEVQFYLIDMPVVIKDGTRTIAGNSSFRALVDWGSSPISGHCSEDTCLDGAIDGWCGPRNGLIGPKLLVDLKASMTLHGGSATSEVERGATGFH